MTEETNAQALKGKRGLKRLINAARYSKDGFCAAFASEEAFRQEVILGVVLLALLPFLTVPLAIKLVGVMSVAFVWVTELLNSGLEAAIDRIGPEIHPLSKQAKDIGSCAVLVSLLTAAVVWTVIFGYALLA